jgi:hypothetical protein
MADNLLYYGDNLDILRRYFRKGAIYRICLAPQFKSNRDCRVHFTFRW